MSLIVKDKQLLENSNKIWKKIERYYGDEETTYGDDDKYIKIKMKTYKDNINTNCYNKIGCKKSTKRKNTT